MQKRLLHSAHHAVTCLLLVFQRLPQTPQDLLPCRTKTRGITAYRMVEYPCPQCPLDRTARDIGASIGERRLSNDIVELRASTLLRDERSTRRSAQNDAAQLTLLDLMVEQPLANALPQECAAHDSIRKCIHQVVLCEKSNPLGFIEKGDLILAAIIEVLE